jgi:hypothetical protein
MAALQTKLPRLQLLSAIREPSAMASWGVLMPGAEHPSPATFVVDRAGFVRWRYSLQSTGDWPQLTALTHALGSTP